MTTIVTWVRDTDGNYEVSSANHLRQLMHMGTLYTDAGDFPADYYLNGTKYLQTVDIDLLGDSTDIQPIGMPSQTATFAAGYDGNNHSISNWVYLDPEFETSNDCLTYVGLFGNGGISNIGHISYIKNIRMTGVCKIQGVTRYAGMIIGRTSGIAISNITCDLSAGSCIDEGEIGTNNGRYFGGVAGAVWGGDVSGLTVKGSLEYKFNETNTFTSYGGGVIADVQEVNTSIPVNMNGVQNLATFTSPIKATFVGGIFGFCNNASVTDCINAMIGDLIGTTSAGGIAGQLRLRSSETCNTLVNAMTGDITTTGIFDAGGIAGYIRGYNFSAFFNYMSGNISASNTSRVGGLAGSIQNNIFLTSSINAMNGSVYNSVLGSGGGGNFIATVDTSFGLTFTVDAHSTASPPTGLLTDSGFPDLPYVSIAGTGANSHTFEYDFVFANLAGSSSYSSYTHLVLHKGDIDTPFHVNFDIPENGTTLYLTFVNYTTGVVYQPGLTIIVPTHLTIEPRSINVVVTIDPVDGALEYRLTHQGPVGAEITSFSGFNDVNRNIVNLEPDTQYTIRLYTDTGSGYELTEEHDVSTLVNGSENYDIADFEEDGVFNLTSANDATRIELSSVMNTLFNTGDTVSVSVDTEPELNTSFIRLGESLTINQTSGLLIPFDGSNGSGQGVTVVLSDDVTGVAVTYDDSNNTIDVNSTVYSPGDVFILDGQKTRVLDF